MIVLLGFEVFYIALQAFRKMPSHYNVSTPFYSAMFTLMALAATIVTLWTANIGILFFFQEFKDLPSNYLWGIRLGIFIFVIFSFEGFLMGSRMSHTIGASDGTPGVPFLNWSKNFGDLRIVHFFGMHALQVIPILSYFQVSMVGSGIQFSLSLFSSFDSCCFTDEKVFGVNSVVGIGVSPRPPPIAPAKLRGLFGFDEFSDFAPERTESNEPFADW